MTSRDQDTPATRATRALKRLLGAGDTPTGVETFERNDRQCTVCGTVFDPGRATCPDCGSQLFRTTTRVPHPTYTLLVAMGLAGVEIVYNVLSGRYPKEGTRE